MDRMDRIGTDRSWREAGERVPSARASTHSAPRHTDALTSEPHSGSSGQRRAMAKRHRTLRARYRPGHCKLW